MIDLNFKLERTIVICAERNTVFRYFTDSKRWASWWGEGSTIESKPGGKVRICYPGNTIASGEVIEIANNERIVFTYGYETGKPIPPGTSKVTFILRDHTEGTEISFCHEFADEAIRDMHIGGWRYQLAVFATVVTKEQHSNYKQILADYLALWDTADSKSREQTLARIAAPDVHFRDPYGCVNDRDEFNAHIDSTQKHMPGLSMAQNGEPGQCQGYALLPWIAMRKDGTEAARGTSTFQFMPNGLIKNIIGFWITAS